MKFSAHSPHLENQALPSRKSIQTLHITPSGEQAAKINSEESRTCNEYIPSGQPKMFWPDQSGDWIALSILLDKHNPDKRILRRHTSEEAYEPGEPAYSIQLDRKGKKVKKVVLYRGSEETGILAGQAELKDSECANIYLGAENQQTDPERRHIGVNISGKSVTGEGTILLPDIGVTAAQVGSETRELIWKHTHGNGTHARLGGYKLVDKKDNLIAVWQPIYEGTNLMARLILRKTIMDEQYVTDVLVLTALAYIERITNDGKSSFVHAPGHFRFSLTSFFIQLLFTSPF